MATIGRIVHVRHPNIRWKGAQVAPAIVTGVRVDGKLDLTAFPNLSVPEVIPDVGKADGEGDGWFWPPREEAPPAPGPVELSQASTDLVPPTDTAGAIASEQVSTKPAGLL